MILLSFKRKAIPDIGLYFRVSNINTFCRAAHGFYNFYFVVPEIFKTFFTAPTKTLTYFYRPDITPFA
jgi:hypothetical protein